MAEWWTQKPTVKIWWSIWKITEKGEEVSVGTCHYEHDHEVISYLQELAKKEPTSQFIAETKYKEKGEISRYST